MKIFFQPLFYYVLGLILANLVIAAPVGEVDARAYNEEYTLAERSIDGEYIEARSEEWEPLYIRDVNEVELADRSFFGKVFGGVKKVAGGLLGFRDESSAVVARAEDELLFTREYEFDSLYEREFEDASLEERSFFGKIFGGIKKVAKVGSGMLGFRSEEGVAARSVDGAVESRSFFGKIFGGIKKVAKVGAGMLGFRSEDGGVVARSFDEDIAQRSFFGKIFGGIKKVAKVGAGMLGF